MMRSFVKSLFFIQQNLILLMAGQVIRASRILNKNKYAKLYMCIHDISVIQAIRFGSWEWYNIDNYRHLIKTRQIFSNTFLDIGSNIGFYSCNLSGYFSSVLAFEPDPIKFYILKANTMLTEKKSSTFYNCFNVALGSNVDSSNLESLSGDNLSVSFFNQPVRYSDSNQPSDAQRSNASIAISDNISDINAVSAIKIVADGSEINVLNDLSLFFKLVDNLPLLTIPMLDITSNQEILNLLVVYGYTHFYSYKGTKFAEYLGLAPSMFKLSINELSVGRYNLVYCSAYPLTFK